MKRMLSIAVLCLLALSACKKEKAQTRTDIITSHEWLLLYVGVNEIPIDLKECDLDDYYVFNTDGTGREDKGQLKCGTDITQYYDFQWSFMSSDENKLVIRMDDIPMVYDIEEISNATLHMKMYDGGHVVELKMIAKN